MPQSGGFKFQGAERWFQVSGLRWFQVSSFNGQTFKIEYI
jgi:hypothetical protein